MSDRKVRAAIIGVGNCASSLVHGVEFYRDASESNFVPGLIHVSLAGYHIRDIEFSVAFNVNVEKVGKNLSEAIFAPPNNKYRFLEVPHKGVTVRRGRSLDGLGKYLRDVVSATTSNHRSAR